MRRKISPATWEQIKVAYVSGIALRELARKMAIPEGTVLQHAKRNRWTQQLKAATGQLSTLSSDVITPPQPVPAPVSHSVAEIMRDHKTQTKYALAKWTAAAAEEAAQHRNKLSIAGKVKDVAGVHRTLWPEEERREQIIDLAVVTGAFRPLAAPPDESERARERAVSEQKEEERGRTSQSVALTFPDATNATNPSIARQDNAHGSVEDPLASDNQRIAARIAFKKKCKYWRSDS
jgi:hypothetical protein